MLVDWNDNRLAVAVRHAVQHGPEQLRAHVSRQVASWWLPDEFIILDAIPTTGTGKLSKEALRQSLRHS